MRPGVPLLVVAGTLVAACQPHLGPIAPASLPALEANTVRSWIAAVAPRHAVRYDLVWHLENKLGNTAGRAVARIATPDSLRFDYRAPFGRSGAAVVLGDSALWVRPAADINTILPAAPLLWLALAAPQVPPVDARIYGEEKGGRRVWRVSRADEAMDVVFEPGRPIMQDGAAHPAAHLLAQWRRADRLLGACEVTIVDGRPVEAVLTFPETSARFRFSVEAADTLVNLDPAIWSPPR